MLTVGSVLGSGLVKEFRNLIVLRVKLSSEVDREETG